MLFDNVSKIVARNLGTIAISGAGIGIGIVFGCVIFLISYNPKTYNKLFNFHSLNLIKYVVMFKKLNIFSYSIFFRILNMLINILFTDTLIIDSTGQYQKKVKLFEHFLLFAKAIKKIPRLFISFFDSSILFVIINKIHDWFVIAFKIEISNSIIFLAFGCVAVTLIICIHKNLVRKVFTYFFEAKHKIYKIYKLNISKIIDKFTIFKINCINPIFCNFIDWIYFKPWQYFSLKLFNINYILVDSLSLNSTYKNTDLSSILSTPGVDHELLVGIYLSRLGKFRFHLLFWLVSPLLTCCQTIILLLLVLSIILCICIQSLHPDKKSFKKEVFFFYNFFRAHQSIQTTTINQKIYSFALGLYPKAIWFILGTLVITIMSYYLDILTKYEDYFNFSINVKILLIIFPLRSLTMFIGSCCFFIFFHLYDNLQREFSWLYYFNRVVLSVTMIYYRRMAIADYRVEGLLVFLLSYDFPSGLVNNKFTKISNKDGTTTWRLNYPFHRRIISTFAITNDSSKPKKSNNKLGRRHMFTTSRKIHATKLLSLRMFSAKALFPTIKFINIKGIDEKICSNVKDHAAVSIDWCSPDNELESGLVTLTSVKTSLEVDSISTIVDESGDHLDLPTKKTKLHPNILYTDNSIHDKYKLPKRTSEIHSSEIDERVDTPSRREMEFIYKIYSNPEVREQTLKFINQALTRMSDRNLLFDSKGRVIETDRLNYEVNSHDDGDNIT